MSKYSTVAAAFVILIPTCLFIAELYLSAKLSLKLLDSIENARVECNNDVELFCNEQHSAMPDFYMLMFGDGDFPTTDKILTQDFIMDSLLSVNTDTDDDSMILLLPLNPFDVFLEFKFGSRRLTSTSITNAYSDENERILENTSYGFGSEVDQCLGNIRKGVNPLGVMYPPPILSQSCDASIDFVDEKFEDLDYYIYALKLSLAMVKALLVIFVPFIIYEVFFEDDEEHEDGEEETVHEYDYVPLKDDDNSDEGEKVYVGLPLRVI